MPFSIDNLTATDNPLKRLQKPNQYTTTLTFALTAPTDKTIKIEYSLSDSNSIHFIVNGKKVKSFETTWDKKKAVSQKIVLEAPAGSVRSTVFVKATDTSNQNTRTEDTRVNFPN
ncbi:MAG: hypothetical protein P0Y53_19130 [Candidatus Pseudobacter hemicellulosilyticus]|uniref:Uncharacterized protein n=1 Tax=Candidatus Pseudobacter hemicellulosilyticus TaxID=3121375 RepID=A0AAJ5WUB6_9BACT|nr:MAG: hypothetical protein P0Y53_19130 [Pseudobacter sp.]